MNPNKKYIYIENKTRRVNRSYIYTVDENLKRVQSGSIKLYPGVNIIEANVFKQLQPDLKLAFENNELKILHKDTETAAKYDCSVDFHKLTNKQAESLIENIYSIYILKQIKEYETRDSVRAKLINQIEQMEQYNERKKQE